MNSGDNFDFTAFVDLGDDNNGGLPSSKPEPDLFSGPHPHHHSSNGSNGFLSPGGYNNSHPPPQPLHSQQGAKAPTKTNTSYLDNEPVINVVAPADDEFLAAEHYADGDFPIYNSNGVPLAETPTFSLTTSFRDSGDMMDNSGSQSLNRASSATPVSSIHSPSMPTSPAQSLYGVPTSPAIASSVAGSPIPFPTTMESPYLTTDASSGEAYPMLDDNFLDLNNTGAGAGRPVVPPNGQFDLEELFGLTGSTPPADQPSWAHRVLHQGRVPRRDPYPTHHSLDVPRTSWRHRASSDPWDGTGIKPVGRFDGVGTIGVADESRTTPRLSPALTSPHIQAVKEPSPSESARIAYEDLIRPHEDVYANAAKAEDYPSPYHGSPQYLHSPSSGSRSPNLSRSASHERSGEDRAQSPYDAPTTANGDSGLLAVPHSRPRAHSASELSQRKQKPSVLFACELCSKRFTRAYNLRSHMRTHMDERPFSCQFCNKSFARQHDRKRHEELHSGEKRFICYGEPSSIQGFVKWGCRRRFARADALGRHFRTEAGKMCLKPLIAMIRSNGDNAATAPEGIVFNGIEDNVPRLTLIGGDPADQSRRTVLLTAVSEQLMNPPKLTATKS